MNLFEPAEPPATGEEFDTLWQTEALVIERIRSASGTGPQHFRQPHDEWVLLVRGEARLEVGGVVHVLRAGDHVAIPRNTPHTLHKLTGAAEWLAVHARPSAAGAAEPADGRAL